MARVSAVFDNHAQAEQAVTDLRALGVRDDKVSVVARGQHEGVADGETDAEEVSSGIGIGILAGGGAGVLFGLAAAAIPGVGPFIAAGAWASALGAAGSGAVGGAIVGATAGAITGWLTRIGYDKEEAEYYGGRIESGDTLVSVDSAAITDAQARGIFARHGGNAYAA